MRRITPILIACLFVFVAVALSAEKKPTTSAAPPDRAKLVQRGEYLVKNVGMCHDCHSPRDERGQFVESRWLGGSRLSFKPTVPMPFAEIAPPLAGLEGYKEADMVTFLSTGKLPNGGTPRPPMPEYRLNAEDAAAVVAYLKSLKPVPPDGSLAPAPGSDTAEKK